MAKLEGRLGTWELPHVHRWNERGVTLRQGRVPLVAPNTKVATIGSCFAAELAKGLGRMQLRGGMHPGGLFYSTRTVRQELERIFNGWPAYDAEPLWRCAGGWVHPFKDYGRAFDTPEQVRSWSDALDREADALFREAEVIVITLGLVETWVHPARDVCYRQIPHPDVFVELDARLRRLTVADMIEDLTRIRELLRKHSDASMVLTVSPVPLHATMTDLDVRVANTESKSRIRAAVSELVERTPDVHYFPSYELVTTAERMSDFLREDGRHVHRRAVDYILTEFVRLFGADELSIAPDNTDWITPPLRTAARVTPEAQGSPTWVHRAAGLLATVPPLDRLARGLWQRIRRNRSGAGTG